MLPRSYLKKVFWPNLGVGPSLQVLDILEYACYRSDCYAVGLKLGPALILNQNPFFEMASTTWYILCQLTLAVPTKPNPSNFRIDPGTVFCGSKQVFDLNKNS